MHIKPILIKFTLFAVLGCMALLIPSKNADAFSVGNSFAKVAFLSAYQDSFVTVSSEDRGVQAQAFIDKMGQHAVSFLSNDKLSLSQKQYAFRQLLNNNFDMRTIGRFVMGRNWKAATDKQRNEYQKLFEDLIVEVYSARFGEYKGENFDVSGVRSTGKQDYLVTSYITSETGPKVQMDWRVRDKNGKFRIIDIIIEGVSMSVTQRSDFASVIQRGGGNIEVLLAHLRK